MNLTTAIAQSPRSPASNRSSVNGHYAIEAALLAGS